VEKKKKRLSGPEMGHKRSPEKKTNDDWPFGKGEVYMERKKKKNGVNRGGKIRNKPKKEPTWGEIPYYIKRCYLLLKKKKGEEKRSAPEKGRAIYSRWKILSGMGGERPLGGMTTPGKKETRG